MEVIDYIVSEAYILIPVLYIIGMFLKSTPCVADWVIPWVLLILGVIGAFFLGGMTVESVLQGVLVAGATVFANQLIKQTKRRDGGR